MEMKSDTGAGKPCSASGDYLKKQCLRILRCTAHAMANSPGGLRFKAGTRPWLEGLPKGGRGNAVCDALLIEV